MFCLVKFFSYNLSHFLKPPTLYPYVNCCLECTAVILKCLLLSSWKPPSLLSCSSCPVSEILYPFLIRITPSFCIHSLVGSWEKDHEKCICVLRFACLNCLFFNYHIYLTVYLGMELQIESNCHIKFRRHISMAF